MSTTSAQPAIALPAAEQRVRAFELAAGLDWLNVPAPLSIGSLHGRIVLLQFWSASGIHCAAHVAEMNHLHGRFREGVSVIGIHVPKFTHERTRQCAVDAVCRLGIRYPVAHDPGFVTWQHYGIGAWPSLAVIDAQGRLAARLPGERPRDALESLVEHLLEEAAATGTRSFHAAEDVRLPEPRQSLSFPARLAASERRLYIADTGHHRVLECTHEGRIERVFGSGNPEFLDGPGHEASFNAPHGLALAHDMLYVADTGNNAVRRIRLLNGQVDTIAGSGRRGPAATGKPGRNALCMPLDLLVRQDAIYIAMAGCHQIWRLRPGESGSEVIAGSGRMGAGDGSPLSASFAQPSGLAVAGQDLVVSDADASALRLISLAEPREVRTVIGAGLFVFGDADGYRGDARLQYPQGLCSDPRGQQVFIADCYNGKIRILHAATGELRSLAIPYPLREPSGVAVAAGALWVANTAAHEVVRFDLARASASRIAVGE
jgi:DNA-binding beta-propeller fold protein YncE